MLKFRYKEEFRVVNQKDNMVILDNLLKAKELKSIMPKSFYSRSPNMGSSLPGDPQNGHTQEKRSGFFSRDAGHSFLRQARRRRCWRVSK